MASEFALRDLRRLDLLQLSDPDQEGLVGRASLGPVARMSPIAVVELKVIGRLKSGPALATIPTHHYGADSAWQHPVTLTHNLLTNFQIETGTARKAQSRKRTALYCS